MSNQNLSMDEMIKKLSAPFPFSEIEWMPKSKPSQNNNILAVPYVNSRAIQNRLDEVVGPFYWRNEFMLWQPNSQICSISIYCQDLSEWVYKQDGADNSDQEPIKGGLSSALKRAAVLWNIGRYLYDIESIWVPFEAYGDNKYRIAKDSYKILESKYNQFINNLKSKTSQSNQSNASPNQNQQPSQQQSQPNQQSNVIQYDYKIDNAQETGDYTSLRLLDPTGNQYNTFARKGNADLKNGSLLKNVVMDKKEDENVGTYYLLQKYEIAA